MWYVKCAFQCNGVYVCFKQVSAYQFKAFVGVACAYTRKSLGGCGMYFNNQMCISV
jgi:hypothetical protein